MSLTQEQILHLSKLTSLAPRPDLSVDSVLDSFASLADTDTTRVSIPTRSWKNVLSLRQDAVKEDTIADALLDCSVQKKAAHQIVLGGIIPSE